jgi:putative protease
MFDLRDHQTKCPEILAPAGGREQFMAALNAGADAVYLGLKQFNARARAENFSIDDLKELVPLAHSFGMKVLVAVNILIKDHELSDLVETLSGLEEVGVDAVIVQDLAVARLVRECFPGLRLHASTQLAVHNAAGVQQAIDWGFKRVVLARELTALELKKIREKFPRDVVELEAFCHGSLCYSYSGLCFFSGANDARSGNRGECAYTCRQPYKIVSEPGAGFLFSMRDLDTADSLKAFVEAGIDTLKIEGRKKDAQYVSSVVRLYRQKLGEIAGPAALRADAPAKARELLDAAREEAIREDLNFSFQRLPTSFFFKGRYHENVIDLANPTHKGIRIGQVIEVRKGRHPGEDTWVKFLTRRALERFDGIRVETAENKDDLRARYENETCSFALREFRVNGVPATHAEFGTIVEARIPAGVVTAEILREIQAGQAVFKTRSNDLKRRVEALSQAPADARMRPMVPVEIKVSVTGEIAGKIGKTGKLRITAIASRFGEAVCEASVECGYEPVSNVANIGALDRDLAQLFRVMDGFVCEVGVAIDNPLRDAFVPRQILKALKRHLRDGLESNWGSFIAARRERAMAVVAAVNHAAGSMPDAGVTSLAVKIDRVEYLDALRELLATDDGARAAIDEVVFEPKRAFLGTTKPEAFLEPLRKFAAETGVKIRMAMPVVIRAWDEPLLRVWATAAVAAGFSAWEIGNAGALPLLRSWGIIPDHIATDFTLYALNHVASGFLAGAVTGENSHPVRVTLSVEDDLKNLRAQVQNAGDVEFQQILYKDTPLFIAESCSLTALHDGCPTSKVCGYRTLEVENPKGERFFVAHESCKSIVYGKEAYSVTQHRGDFAALGINRFRVDFLTRPYEARGIMEIIRAALTGGRVDGTHSANFTGELL